MSKSTLPAPQHCDREMLAVKNSANAPIWWCPECHFKLPRTEDKPEAS